MPLIISDNPPQSPENNFANPRKTNAIPPNAFLKIEATSVQSSETIPPTLLLVLFQSLINQSLKNLELAFNKFKPSFHTTTTASQMPESFK
jgi:hypothetical protein